MSQVTPEIEELERKKTYFAHEMRLHDLRIKEIRTKLDLEKITSEIEDLSIKLENLR